MNELIFSAPGRVELGGNHTDHQRGCVLAAAIDRTTRARVRLTRSPVVRVFSRGYDPVTLRWTSCPPGRGSGTPVPPWSGAWPPPLPGGASSGRLRRLGGVRCAARLRPLQQRRL